MMPVALLAIITVTLSFFITYMVRIYAIKKNILDTPNQRSSHTIPTPRGGGVAIGICWFIALIFLYLTEKITPTLFYAMLPGLILFAVGIIDDIYDIKPFFRLISQALASGLALYFLGGLPEIDFGFFNSPLPWLWTAIAFIGIIWFINLFNFLDGIDGYAAMEAIFVSLSFYLIINDSILLLLAASTLGFLFWNWQPAKIFMGDVGSTLLGFNLIILVLYYQNTTDISIFTLLIPSVLFWFDASWTLLRRFRNREKLSEAHKKHAYQRIVQAGFSHQKTVILALSVNLIIFIILYFSFVFNRYVLIWFLISIFVAYLLMKQIDKKKPFKGSQQKN